MPAAKRSPRALVVDDSEDVAESFARALETMGCEATFITNPYLAVETARRIKAYATEEDRARSRRAGFDAHIVKPVSPELVQNMLHTLFPEMR